MVYVLFGIYEEYEEYKEIREYDNYPLFLLNLVFVHIELKYSNTHLTIEIREYVITAAYLLIRPYVTRTGTDGVMRMLLL